MKESRIDRRSIFGDEPLRSAVGCDPGLASFGIAHVERIVPAEGIPTHSFKLAEGHLPCSGVFLSRPVEGETVAESNAARVRDLHHWLRLRLQHCVSCGAEAVAAERYEHVRASQEAAKLAAGHAVLACVTSSLEPRPSRQRAGSGLPAYVNARDAKRATTGCGEATKRVVARAIRRLVHGAVHRLDGTTVEAGAHLADACAVALHALGHRERPVLVCPAGEGDAALARVLALIGKPRARCSLCGGRGLSTSVSAVNGDGSVEGACPAVCFCTLDPRSVGAFEVREGLLRAEDVDGRAVVFAGRRVANQHARLISAKRAVRPELSWFEARPGEVAFMAAVLPEASSPKWAGRDPKVRAFLRAAARVT